MSAALAMKKEEPRLYSRGYRMRAPVDEIAPQHEQVHELLVRWGSWANSRGARRGLASVEGLYTKGGTPPATAPLAADKAIVAVERAMIGLPVENATTLRRLYVYRMTPPSICKAMRPPLRYEAWQLREGHGGELPPMSTNSSAGGRRLATWRCRGSAARARCALKEAMGQVVKVLKAEQEAKNAASTKIKAIAKNTELVTMDDIAAAKRRLVH